MPLDFIILLKNVIKKIFNDYDISLNEFTVGNPENKTNPETGYPEFFFNKIVSGVKRIFRGGGSSKKKSSSNNNWDDQAKQMAERQAKQLADMKKKMEEDRKRIEAEAAERLRKQKIEQENQKAADFRRQSENKLQSDFTSAAQNQKLLDQQAAQKYASTTVGGSGYNVGSAQQQKIAAAGGVAGPASTNAPSSMQMGIPFILASNAGVGGTQQTTNQFTLPSAQGLQFGGM